MLTTTTPAFQDDWPLEKRLSFSALLYNYNRAREYSYAVGRPYGLIIFTCDDSSAFNQFGTQPSEIFSLIVVLETCLSHILGDGIRKT